jgi:hypothetical protein
MVAAPQKSSTNKKDFSKLYKKTAPTIIPINVPSMGLDLELEYTAPTADVGEILDQYIIAVARATSNDQGSVALDLPSEHLLAIGKYKLIDLAIYLKKMGATQRAETLAQEVDGIKNAKLIALRDRLTTSIAELKLSLDPKYDDYEKLSFFMVSAPEAKELLHRAIASCFKEIEEPERLEDQVKFFLMMALLSITSRVVAI